ncbi:hypothetical protein BGW42_007173 [Actinomortierella wolfii]|nr:hypothetical protein BGW42_007173 [Actinomortierella wolfii]
MANSTEPVFSWSSTFSVGSPSPHQGDKILLPAKALESLIQAHANAPTHSSTASPVNYDPTSWDSPPPAPHHSRQHELPSPLTFEIRNPSNRMIAYGGVKEFSAEDGKTHLPSALMESLKVQEGDQVMIRFAGLPKGVAAKFRPLSAEYLQIVDFRSAFEAYLRSHYTTLSTGMLLTIRQGAAEYTFVVEELQPAKAVCITDTDLEVDIEPLAGSEGKLVPQQTKDEALRIGQPTTGVVNPNEYKRYKIDLPVRTNGIMVEVQVEKGDVDVLASTKMPVTLTDHIWADFSLHDVRQLKIVKADQDYTTSLEASSLLHFAIHGRPTSMEDKQPATYTIRVRFLNNDEETSASAAATAMEEVEVPNQGAEGYAPCHNCGAWIPERTMMLHSNFCERNNVRCDKCGKVMKKDEIAEHFHCDHCPMVGHIREKNKHMDVYHGWYQCSCDSYETASLPELAQHRRTTCAERYITCRYCHTIVQQGPPASNARDRIRGLGAHESYCGDRTIECQKCKAKVSLKDVQVHAQNHEYQRQNQALPQFCSNQNCVRPKAAGGNALGACQICFGPFWSPNYDPKHQKLIQRLARRYHTQLMTGCGNSWCKNPYCATAKGETMDATSAATELMGIIKEVKLGQGSGTNGSGKIWLCVDEGTTRKRMLAEMLHEDVHKKYALEWCIKAIVETSRTSEDLGTAAKWLQQQAPRLS